LYWHVIVSFYLRFFMDLRTDNLSSLSETLCACLVLLFIRVIVVCDNVSRSTLFLNTFMYVSISVPQIIMCCHFVIHLRCVLPFYHIVQPTIDTSSGIIYTCIIETTLHVSVPSAFFRVTCGIRGPKYLELSEL
jgi:hypothetical protein